MATVKMFPVAPATAPIQIQLPVSGTITSGTDGSMTVDVRDIPEAQRAGFSVVQNVTNRVTFDPAPAAANSALLFASGAITASMAIAAQPDYGRQVQCVMYNTSTLATAGTLTFTYNASDGTVGFVDALSAVTGASTTTTIALTKGVEHMTLMSSAVTGGSSPSIIIGTTAKLAVPVPLNAQDVAILGELMDTTGATTANAGSITNAGIYTTNTAPNATHTYSVSYVANAW